MEKTKTKKQRSEKIVNKSGISVAPPKHVRSATASFIPLHLPWLLSDVNTSPRVTTATVKGTMRTATKMRKGGAEGDDGDGKLGKGEKNEKEDDNGDGNKQEDGDEQEDGNEQKDDNGKNKLWNGENNEQGCIQGTKGDKDHDEPGYREDFNEAENDNAGTNRGEEGDKTNSSGKGVEANDARDEANKAGKGGDEDETNHAVGGDKDKNNDEAGETDTTLALHPPPRAAT
ncbi:hypothetical protein L208DRAFT_1527323 [Tricholoma matsutake]|nr:hypothetical protein L208DRAFT_1527323 [Tricholoma matsutake 945]